MSIAAHGTEAQKARWIPAILRGEVSFGLGYSEPDSGSDLASLKTRAVRDGDEWVITGQKIWTSSWKAKYMWLAARTDPDAKPKHAGISLFIVPTDSKGLTIRPMKALHGKTFANVFYDGVRLPADALVGEVNGGWKVLTGALATERNIMGAVVARVVSAFELLTVHLRARRDGGDLAGDAAVRDRIGELAADIEAARQLIVHSVAMAGHDESAGGIDSLVWSAMSKVFSAELMERFGEMALDILGPAATLSTGAAGAAPDGSFEQFLRHSIMYVVGGGTAEIQRNVIAQRGLGLPR
jgi:alkylation response protein AidB-like acyl-CoA dehydrogenase